MPSRLEDAFKEKSPFARYYQQGLNPYDTCSSSSSNSSSSLYNNSTESSNSSNSLYSHPINANINKPQSSEIKHFDNNALLSNNVTNNWTTKQPLNDSILGEWDLQGKFQQQPNSPIKQKVETFKSVIDNDSDDIFDIKIISKLIKKISSLYIYLVVIICLLIFLCLLCLAIVVILVKK